MLVRHLLAPVRWHLVALTMALVLWMTAMMAVHFDSCVFVELACRLIEVASDLKATLLEVGAGRGRT